MMDHNPYSPPRTEVAEFAAPQEAGPRPRQVTWAVQCLWLDLLLSVAQASRGPFSWQPEEGETLLYFMLAFAAVLFSAQTFVIFKLGARRSWARYVFLVTTILSVIQYLRSLPQEWLADHLNVGLNALELVLDSTALFLVFTGPGKEWFKKRLAG